MRLLDFVDIHQYEHSAAVLWLVRSGPNAGTITYTAKPNTFAFVIKDSRLTSRRLEYLLYQYCMLGLLTKAISGEDFLLLMVDVDHTGVRMADVHFKPDQIHG